MLFMSCFEPMVCQKAKIMKTGCPMEGHPVFAPICHFSDKKNAILYHSPTSTVNDNSV